MSEAAAGNALVWRGATPLARAALLGDAAAIAARLPSNRYLVNLCEQRDAFEKRGHLHSSCGTTETLADRYQHREHVQELGVEPSVGRTRVVARRVEAHVRRRR